jgi:hypothetical protein
VTGQRVNYFLIPLRVIKFKGNKKREKMAFLLFIAEVIQWTFPVEKSNF